MASLTRNRCTDANKPTPATVRHYADRARDGAGFIVAKETFVYLNGTEWPHAPKCSIRVMWRLGGRLRMGCMGLGIGFCFSHGILVNS